MATAQHNSAHDLLFAYLRAQECGVMVRFVARDGEMPVRVDLAHGEAVITVNRWCGLGRTALAQMVEHLAQVICSIAQAVYHAAQGVGLRTIPAYVAVGA